MTFSGDLKRFQDKVEFRTHEVFVETASEAHKSIQSGSEITGAPGQPVDTGNLKGSWILSFPSRTLAEISTNVVYAPSIEDGVSYAHGGTPMTLRSSVGGFHSLKHTRAGIERIVEAVTKRLYGDNS